MNSSKKYVFTKNYLKKNEIILKKNLIHFKRYFFIFTFHNLPNQNVKKNHITIPYISTVK